MASSRSLGTLTLDLILKMGGFQEGMDKAAKNTQQRTKEMEKAFEELGDKAKEAAAFIGVAFTADYFKEQVLQAVELGDQMGKLAEKTGLTASAASELSNVFKQNDLDTETLSKSITTMQINLAKGSKSFAAIGLNIDELRSKRPDEAFEDIAEAS
jgi:hypothetical protein